MLKTTNTTINTADKTTEGRATGTATKSTRGRTRALGLSIGAAILLSACSGPARPELTQQPIIVHPTTIPNELTSSVAAVIPSESVRAISTVETLSVFTQPGDADPVAYLDQRTELGSARVLLVEQLMSDWVQVRLSQRPNESLGWVRADNVTVERLDVVVKVDLAQRQLTVFNNGAVSSVQSIAIGSNENPTPTGTFFITDKLDTNNDDGAYGPYAIGLSAYSESLTEFAGGDGQIGIHGTNDPASIGQSVSHGCVRLPNEIITMLATDLPLGTMVVIL
jgi:lipoprotein-anchoring transpeptidase ErfK/SrfK